MTMLTIATAVLLRLWIYFIFCAGLVLETSAQGKNNLTLNYLTNRTVLAMPAAVHFTCAFL